MVELRHTEAGASGAERVTGLIDTPLGAMRDGLLQLLNSLGTWGYTLPSMLF